MSNVPEEPDREAIALIKKLGPAQPRDPKAAAIGRSRFLAEARPYRASVSARPEERRIAWKENAMRLSRIPVALLVIVVIGVAMIYVSGRFLLGGNVLMSRSFSAQPSQNISQVFVAGQNIPQGARITPDMLSTISVPQDRVSAAEFTVHKKDQLVGKIAKFPLDQGTVITTAMLGESSQVAAAPAPQWAVPTSSAAIPVPPGAGYPGQMIVKNADIRLLVKGTDQALDGVTQATADTQGYVISSRTWFQGYNGQNYKYATLTIGVPADQFENTLRRLRSLAVQVLDENASGQDVTSQYVDLQSQLTNLEATRDRIRTFLDQATTVDDALRVNQQLSEVEGQIEQIKGQMNYLSNRSAFSTITINLEPELPKLVATPTPAATPTPVLSFGPWDAGGTTRRATYTLISAYRLIASFLIWFFVVIVPVFGPPTLLVWLAVWLIRRRNRGGVRQQGA